MKRLLGNIAETFLVLVSAAGTATWAQSQNFTVLHSFTDSGVDGANPKAGLLRDAAGNLYGTTSLGGSCIPLLACGSVFRIDPSGNETVLYSFKGNAGDGAFPVAGLVMDTAGNLYGTTFEGGSANLGTVFKLDSSRNETVLHNFAFSAGTISDGANPSAHLIMDSTGNLYGTTTGGGSATANFGTVFKLDPVGNETILHAFTGGSDGGVPTAALIMDAAGNLYGTTSVGGTSALGTVFKLDPAGNETVLHSFTGASGANPNAGLLMDAAGNFYGTTTAGGSSASVTCSSQTLVGGCGTVFKLDASGNETVLHSFTGYPSDGALPYAGLVMDGAGNLYGTTSQGGPGACTGRLQVVVGCGTVFKLDPAGNETVLYSFTGVSDGAFPFSGHLMMDASSNLYGTASAGGFGTTSAGGPCTVVGGLGGCGTVFKLAVQAPAPTITGISPTSAIAGGPAFTLTVIGTNFINGSTINFNGKALATTFVSATQLTAAIPALGIAAAGTFSVTVTNVGDGTSNAVSFTVLTPQQATQAIISAVNALLSQGVLNGGQDNSLLKQLQQAINLMNAGKNAGAIGNLDSFISEVNDLLSSGVLSPSQAASLTSAAQSVIAAI